MGQKRARSLFINAKVEALRAYLFSYQYSMRALLKALPHEVLRERPSFASIGLYEIWPCSDAAVVLIYPSTIDAIDVEVRESSSKPHYDFLGTSPVATYYSEDGTPVSWRLVPQISDAANHIIYMSDLISSGSLGTFQPKFKKAFLFGWNVPLPEPDDEAVKNLKSDVVTLNLSGNQPASSPEIRERATSMLSQFEELLRTAKREEEPQIFLATHPELLYPDFITCHKKLRLGEDLVTDYVVLVQSSSGQEYVFVEIERPSKPIFTSAGHFSHYFTQAKGQLLEWSTWITENHQYLQRKLPNLGKPTFHLILGRSAELGVKERSILQAEFSGTDRRFGTYDDLIERFRTIVDRILGPEVVT